MKIKGLPGLYDEEPFNPDKLLGFNLSPNDELTDDDIKKELIRIQKQISSMSNEEIVRYSNPNMVKNNITGVIFPKNDAKELYKIISHLRNTPYKLLKMQEDAKKDYFERFSAHKMSQQYEEFYKSIIKSQ